MQKYTEEQIKDIEERELRAYKAIKDLELFLSATTQSVNMGDNTFAMKIIPHFADLKYAPKEEKIEEAKVKEKKNDL